MVYDNEGDSVYLNDTPNCNPVDRDEGAERNGMGVLLAKQCLLTKDTTLKTSLLQYAKFIRELLQTEDYTTYSSVDQKNRNRGYNYMWIAEFYFHMYKITEASNLQKMAIKPFKPCSDSLDTAFMRLDSCTIRIECLKRRRNE